MIIYISGPITGIGDRNSKAFQKAQKEIKQLGKSVKNEDIKIINPVRLGIKLDKQFAQSGKAPEWADYMRVCVRELSLATHVFLLRGWALSDGAAFERFIAERLKIPCAETYENLAALMKGGIDEN
jgi:hypothetical protein